MVDTSNNLAALIRRHQDNTGDSYGDIARRTGLSKAKIGQLADPDTHYLIRPETITKLAAGLNVPEAVLQRAALVTAGRQPDDPTGRTSRIDLIVSQLENLDDDTLMMVEGMVDAAVRQMGRRG